jgi:nitrite reductase/ring-hydroxylating ferredoxin subunit
MLSGALLFGAAQSPALPSAAVRIALASLTLLDFRPTADRQLADARSALAASSQKSNFTSSDFSAGLMAIKWNRLVRGKVIGELAGLALALRAPCTGACLVLLSHQLFWFCGAASTRVDATGAPSPVPPQLAKVIATADAAVLCFAALGAFGPTRAAQTVGALLFSAAAAMLSVESLSKTLKRSGVEGGGKSSQVKSSQGGGTRPRRRAAPPSMRETPLIASTIACKSPRSRAAPPSMQEIAREIAPPSVPTATMANQIWAEQWWPLAFAAHTSRTAPSAVTLMGAPLVLWWDRAGGAWRCTIDRCSHRLAPLSEGRIADDGRCIECPYHGWAFEGATGACMRIPQLDEPNKASGTNGANESEGTGSSLPLGSGPTFSASRAAVKALPAVEVQVIASDSI